MSCTNNNLYIISFLVGTESGLALVSAPDQTTAIQILRNSGSRNCCPEKYTIVQARNIGMTSSGGVELLMESFVNSLAVYDAISKLADKYIKGERGDTVWANAYVDDEMYIHIVESEYAVSSHLDFDQSTGYLTIT